MVDDNGTNRNMSSSEYIASIKQKQDASFLSSMKFVYGTGHLLFVTLKERNITRPTDLNGKKIAVILVENNEMYDYALQYYSQKNNETIRPQLVHRLDYLCYDCLWGYPMDFYDVVVTDSWELQTIMMRLSISLTDKQLSRWSDYHIIQELTIPTLVKYINKNVSDVVVNVKMNYFINTMLTNAMKTDLYSNNVYQLQYIYGNGGFLSENDKGFLNFYFKVDSLNYYQGNETFQFDSLFNGSLIPLDNIFCYDQSISTHIYCGDNNMMHNALLGVAISNYIVLTIGFFYYLSLFSVCKTNTIKRRLLTPYVVPAFIMFNAGFYSTSTDFLCHSLRMTFLLATIALLVGIYGVSTLRFYYLRNLCYIMKIIPERFIKLNRFLSSTGFGIVASLVCGVFHAGIWIIFMASYIFPRDRLFIDDPLVVYTSLFIILSLTACLFGIVVLGIDIIVNWRKIKLKGVAHFLTFEDPYHIRMDIITHACIILCVLVIVLLNVFEKKVESYTYQIVARSVSFISTYFLCGWTAIIMEWIEFFRRRNRAQSSNAVNCTISSNGNSLNEENIEDLVKIGTFFEMFKSFSEKEFSLENTLLFEQLALLENIPNGIVSFGEIEKLYHLFFQPYAMYEVNFPHKTRKDIEALYHSKKDVPLNDLKAILEYDLLMNMKDTFERLKMTGEFKRWLISKAIQTKQSV